MKFSFLTNNKGSVNPNYVPPASVSISKRDEKTQILYDELKSWGLIGKETDMGAVKAIANELSYRMLMRVVRKLQRKRMSGV